MDVSVIIPCYNVEFYIQECFDSLLQQTKSPNQFIFVDNASSDGTLKLLLEFQAAHPELPIHVLQEPKPGACAARNIGLFAAQGKWIQFLDADDLLLPEKLSHQMELLRRDGKVDFIAGACIKRYQDGREQIITPDNRDPWLALPNVQLGNTCANLFRRETLLLISGWDETLKSSQEYDLMFRLLKSGARVFFDPEPLTLVRERPHGSISQMDVLGNNFRRLENLLEIRAYFLQEQFAQIYLEHVEQAIFLEIRRIYRHDPPRALQLYHMHFQKRPEILPSIAISKSYVWTFRLLGYRYTQKLNAWFHKLVHKTGN
ncbi:MAG: glycosyltransferase family 2 protein [Melioribacteraceae bacterium]|nr:glycosyltransferase family 2 protein [Melioribacteraceae bacterium]